jgi:hypothetical protein
MDMPRLTRDVRELLLLLNEGFAETTYYSAKNSSEQRDYQIVDGHLEVRARGKTSWADSRYDKTWVADDAAAHRFLREHRDELNTEGLQEGLDALAAERASRPKPALEPEPVNVVESVAGSTDGVVGPLVFNRDGGQGAVSGRPGEVPKAVVWAGVAVAAVFAARELAPHVGRVWYEHGEPRVRRLRGKFSKAQPVDEHDDEPVEQLAEIEQVEGEPFEQVEDRGEDSEPKPLS